MQLAPIGLLVSQCETLTRQLEDLDAKHPRPTAAQPLFGISGLQTDLQRVYAIDQILIRLEAMTASVQAEVADSIWDLMETIALTYHPRPRISLAGSPWCAEAPKLRERSRRSKQVRS
jgi:hypothetical protein